MYLGYIIIGLNCLGFITAMAGVIGFETENHYKENKTMKELMTKWQYFSFNFIKAFANAVQVAMGVLLVKSTMSVVKQISSQ